MKQLILLSIFLTILLSCNSRMQKNRTVVGCTDSIKSQPVSIENVRFDFEAKSINSLQETIEIKASLFNDNTDTVYFLSSTCDGEQYSLRYDTTKFVLTPMIQCNASFPKIIKIAPNEQHNFQAHFRSRSKETKIKLGFDFYVVDKSFDLSDKTLKNSSIFKRNEEKQTIIWAIEKEIR